MLSRDSQGSRQGSLDILVESHREIGPGATHLRSAGHVLEGSDRDPGEVGACYLAPARPGTKDRRRSVVSRNASHWAPAKFLVFLVKDKGAQFCSREVTGGRNIDETRHYRRHRVN